MILCIRLMNRESDPGRGSESMSDVRIRINLDPLHDGIEYAGTECSIDRTDKQAVVIGTNGKYRQISLKEARAIMAALDHCSASMILDDDYIAVYNSNKTFSMEGADYYAGSMLVLRMAGSRMMPLSEEELKEVMELMKERTAEFRSGAEYFSAIELD